jgi:hypothetical protein
VDEVFEETLPSGSVAVVVDVVFDFTSLPWCFDLVVVVVSVDWLWTGTCAIANPAHIAAARNSFMIPPPGGAAAITAV